MAGVRINDRLSIPLEELEFSLSRGGGPGGQHVNKVSTRVMLRFDVEASTVLSEAQKGRIRRCLPTRINREGVLRVVCGRHRSAAGNRREALERFAELLRQALRRRTRRRPTAVPEGSRRRRLENKRRRGQLKRQRRATADD